VFGFHRSSTEVLPSSNVQRKETIEDFHRCSTEVLPSPSNVQRKETIEAYTHVWAPAESPLQLGLQVVWAEMSLTVWISCKFIWVG
jgi:hypothetical protein